MKTSRIATLSLAALVLAAAGAAQADTLTRAQVKAELAEAQRTGNLTDYELGQRLNEAFPRAYPAQVKVPSVQTVAQPSASAQTAVAPTGDVEYDAIAQRSAQALARGADGVQVPRTASAR